MLYFQLFEKMCMMLGGRVSESITFNKVTSGNLHYHPLLNRKYKQSASVATLFVYDVSCMTNLFLGVQFTIKTKGVTGVVQSYYTGMFPVGDTSCRTLIDVCVCVCVCVSLSADISLNCAKNDSTDYPEILWVCWV